MAKQVYVECFGEVYRLSHRNWLRLLRDISKGSDFNLPAYGNPVVPFYESIQDFTPDQARESLAEAKGIKE